MHCVGATGGASERYVAMRVCRLGNAHAFLPRKMAGLLWCRTGLLRSSCGRYSTHSPIYFRALLCVLTRQPHRVAARARASKRMHAHAQMLACTHHRPTMLVLAALIAQANAHTTSSVSSLCGRRWSGPTWTTTGTCGTTPSFPRRSTRSSRGSLEGSHGHHGHQPSKRTPMGTMRRRSNRGNDLGYFQHRRCSVL